MKNLKISFLILLIFTIICGLIYPAVVTGFGYAFVRDKAAGSLIITGDTVRGSTLIGQNFTGEKYFYGRPSSVNYDASLSGGSNLAFTNRFQAELIIKRAEDIKALNNLTYDYQVPEDLLSASGSGLDPHISIDSALIQADRVSSARNIEKNSLTGIIESCSERQLPFYGRRFVNVLKLNSVLDGMEVKK